MDRAGARGVARLFSGLDGSLLLGFSGAGGDFLGTSVDGAGDVDSDGFADALIGAPFADSGGFNAGAAYVFSGAGGGLLRAFHGVQPGDQLGHRVSTAGDVDGDGRADLAMSSPGADVAGIDSGAAWVYGAADGELLLLVGGTAESEYLGAVSPAGDVDGDGRGDLAVGAAASPVGGSQAGSVRVISGASGEELLAFQGSEPLDWLGAALALAGDTNGDGAPDLVAGAPGHDDELTKPGYARVVSTQSLALASDGHLLSLSLGGEQGLALDGTPSGAGATYYLLGSAAGTAPGISLGGVVLPLAYEPVYFVYTAQHPIQGVLDGAGLGSLVLVLPQGSPPELGGLTLHHAFLVVADGVPQLASNAVPLTLVP